jgi:hypothetical protein
MPFTSARTLTVLACMLAASVLAAQAVPTSQEYPLKAAFIYNLAIFTEWPSGVPERSDARFVIGILGEDPFGAAMDEVVAGKRIKGRPVAVKRLAWGDSVDGCQILFLSLSEKSRIPEIDRLVGGRPVLTVSEGSNFTKQGGMIGFVLEENRIRFEVNVAAARRHHLQLSSKLLRLAKIVK